ncbi:MAG: MFS transporter [Prevotella sp.]|jgi:PAT family beta-lactamase induction signal transducer AmpG|nr:MFS transporter [Prevotella sp.]
MRNQKLSRPYLWVPSLYFAEGLPYVAVMTVSLILYKQLGLSNADITFYTSWLYLPWVIKPLWSPFVDVVKTKRWWILTMEVLIGAAFGGVAFTIPTSFWLQGSLFFFWVMAFSSATHDIAADGFYMLGLNAHQQTFYVGIRSTFYRLATIFGQGVLVMIAGNLQVVYRGAISYSWSLMFYLVMGLFLGLWIWHCVSLPHPAEDAPRKDASAASIMRESLSTFVTFFQKPQWLVGVLFMLLYRMPEGLLAKVSSLFLVDSPSAGGLGLSPQEYGLVQGTVGVIGLTIGGILGGILASRDGLKKWLWPMVMAITLPDVVYVYLSYALPSSLFVVNACVFVEQFGYGFGFTAYMLYLIYYSRGEFKTAHYAFCTAFMALSMMIPGLFAGALQELVGYRYFFIIVMACCAVTFIVTAFLKVDSDFGKKA